MFRATLKSLFARKVRLILTVVSIVLGVGFVVGTFVLTDTMNKAFDDLFQTAASGSDVIVRSEQAFVPSANGPGGGGGEERDPVPEDLVATVQGVDGVASASGDVQGYAQMKDPATGDPIGGVGPPTIGTNWTDTNPSLVLREGEPPGPDEVVVDAGTANRFDLGVGQDVTILFSTIEPEPFTISRDRWVRRCRQPRGGDAGVVRHAHGSTRARQGRRLRLDLRARRRRACPRHAARADPAGAAGQGRGGHQSVGRRRAIQGVEGGPGLLPDVPAGLRGHRGVRRGVHHLQHLLDHRGATFAGVGAAPRDRGEQAAGDDIRGRRVPRGRVRGVGPGHRVRARDRARS